MFSEIAYKNADACRFCWMCRHLCPVSAVTGCESNSVRAKGLIVSMVKRGGEYDESMAKTMWECCLCGACTNDCASGYEPRSFIREARSVALAEGIAPEKVSALADRMLSGSGEMYKNQGTTASLNETLKDVPEKAPVLLYIGQVSRNEAPELAIAAVKLLKKAGVNFAVLKNETVSGGYMGDMLGFVNEVRKKAVELSAAIDASEAKDVVVIDPIDARVMKHEYPEWNCAPRANIHTASSYFQQLVQSGLLKPMKNGKTCSIHDAGALARDLDETAPVRYLMASMGMEIKEMFRHKALSKSCGGALLRQYNPKLSAALAKRRWEDLLRTESRFMVTEAPGSYTVLKSAMPENCEIADVLMLLAEACC